MVCAGFRWRNWQGRKHHMKTARGLAVSIALVAFLAACRIAPVYDVSNSPVPMSGNVRPSADNVQKAIVRAGTTLGWKITPVKPGQMEGRLELRDHVAVVTIDYDATKYSITYKNSTNLNYDGTNIHKNYNGWIQNLDKGIQTQLQNL